MPDDQDAVLIIGGRGEFGQFLQRDILPSLGVKRVLCIERDTPPEQRAERIGQARHIVLATPLAGYAQMASELAEQCRDLAGPTTLWLIASVQVNVWRAVSATLTNITNPNLAAVFVHPMYGPNGFRAKEHEARTFRNILTAIIADRAHRIAAEVAAASDAFQSKLGISTTTDFDPEQHDQATAHSQGLSYCVAQLMFTRKDIDALIEERMPDLHRSFHANRNLINDFLRLNSYVPEVIKVFAESWQQTGQASCGDAWQAFDLANTALHGNAESLIPTKWYERLRVNSMSGKL